MKRARVFVLPLLLALLAALSGRADSQTPTTIYPYGQIHSDTIAVGMQDTTSMMDTQRINVLQLTVKIRPASGTATPSNVIRIRLIGCEQSAADSNTCALVQTQPIADHSYLGSAASDSLAFGWWHQGSSVQLGNGEVEIRFQAPHNTKWPYPDQVKFAINLNKGTQVRSRFAYLQIANLSGNGVARVTIRAEGY